MITKNLPKNPTDIAIAIQKNSTAYLCIASDKIETIGYNIKMLLERNASSYAEGSYLVYKFTSLQGYVRFEMVWSQNMGAPITYMM